MEHMGSEGKKFFGSKDKFTVQCDFVVFCVLRCVPKAVLCCLFNPATCICCVLLVGLLHCTSSVSFRVNV
jgi:hypothetical protein